jgi:hypothetical protein
MASRQTGQFGSGLAGLGHEKSFMFFLCITKNHSPSAHGISPYFAMHYTDIKYNFIILHFN